MPQWADRYLDSVFRFTLSLVRDPETAADLTQDTFLKLQRADGDPSEANIMTGARNTAFSQAMPAARASEGLRKRILAAATATDAATGETEATSQTEGQASWPTAGGPGPRWWRRAAWPLGAAVAASLALAFLGPERLRRGQGEDQPLPFSTPARVVVLRYGERVGKATPVRFGGIDLEGPSQGSSS